MTKRRHLMAAGLAAPALLSLAARPGLAQPAPASGRQAPGFYRTRIGAWTLCSLSDGYGRRPSPTEGFVRNATADQVSAALRDAFLPVEHLDISYTVPVLETPEGITAFDIGTGGQLGATAGRLAENMRAAGLDPARVTRIVFTHFHGDHITGLTDAAGTALYPAAELYVPEPEWAYWMDEATASRAPEAMRGAFANVRRRFAAYDGKIRRFQPGAEILPGIRSVATYGHTPGHSSFVVTEGADSLLILGDITNRPELFVRNPGWHAIFDMDPVQAEETRRRVLDMAAAERLRIAGYHWPFPGLAHVAKDGTGYRYVPLPWSGVV
ncbi:MBL fold metallo-hydrolase [Roseomonas sp. OT10]|uniref:MBL fold metallo-hydrolase n=1 Tax=Roseomonas cutis TaxID=2897332 RepID=UPI001E282565|nr:MBL fold metallo-hydrolase [Roseomonas sp. OT10]UFN48547.1 MBL fold metallo-hydrolase [Roseomonas sp. OT10]